MQNSIENSGIFRVKATTCFVSLCWNGYVFKSTLGFRGKENHEAFQRHLLPFSHLLSDVWDGFSDTENCYILFQRTHGFLIYVQYSSEYKKTALESRRYMVTRMKASAFHSHIFLANSCFIALNPHFLFTMGITWKILYKSETWAI